MERSPAADAGVVGGAIVGVSGIRTIRWTVARRSNLQPRGAALLTRATMLALGLAWGVGAAFVFQYLAVADVALTLLGLTGFLAGGLATLVADRGAFPIYAMNLRVTPPPRAVRSALPVGTGVL